MDTLDNIIKSMAAARTPVFKGSLTPDEINKTLFGTGDTAVVYGIPYDTENDRPGVATIGGNQLEVHNGDVVISAIADTFEIHSHVAIPETPNKKEAPAYAMDAIRQRIQRKRELAEKCTRYYPVMQRCEGFTQQVVAAETVEGAVTIKETMARRNRSEEYFIGPRTIIFSDELAALEFEPTEFERAEMKNEAAFAAAKMNQSRQIDPEEMTRQLIGGNSHGN